MSTLRLHNTLTRKKEDFIPIDPDHVRVYACGPTVYGRIHVGNARPIVVFDVLVRLLRLRHAKVTYVRNITDVDDKINMRAAERGVEGSCWVRFDVTPDGTPTNIDIFRCDSSLFERASVRAVERWRYNPKVEDGVPVARRGVETRFDFRLAE